MEEVTYISDLKQSVTALRRACLRHMHQVYGQPMNQTDWRYGAYVYARHNGPGINPDHLKWDWPAPIANSKVDIYHHNYFIRAVLASLLYPEEPLLYEAYMLTLICTVEPNELVRRENQVALYTKLHELVPIQAAPIVSTKGVASALEQINQKLDQILRCLNDQTVGPSNLSKSGHLAQNENVVGPGSAGGQLDPPKQAKGKRRNKRPRS